MMTDAQVAAQVCVASVVPGTPSTAICSGLPVHRGPAHPLSHGHKSRETIYGASVRAAAERAAEAARKPTGSPVEAWNKRMLGFQGPAQPSPTLGDALNAGFGYLEVKCLGCNTHQTVALDIVRRPKATPVHELERYMRCKDCSRSPGLSLQAQPSGRAARDQDHGERSALDVVAGRTMILSRKIWNGQSILDYEPLLIAEHWDIERSWSDDCEDRGPIRVLRVESQMILTNVMELGL